MTLLLHALGKKQATLKALFEQGVETFEIGHMMFSEGEEKINLQDLRCIKVSLLRLEKSLQTAAAGISQEQWLQPLQSLVALEKEMWNEQALNLEGTSEGDVKAAFGELEGALAARKPWFETKDLKTLEEHVELAEKTLLTTNPELCQD